MNQVKITKFYNESWVTHKGHEWMHANLLIAYMVEKALGLFVDPEIKPMEELR